MEAANAAIANTYTTQEVNAAKKAYNEKAAEVTAIEKLEKAQAEREAAVEQELLAGLQAAQEAAPELTASFMASLYTYESYRIDTTLPQTMI